MIGLVVNDSRRVTEAARAFCYNATTSNPCRGDVFGWVRQDPDMKSLLWDYISRPLSHQFHSICFGDNALYAARRVESPRWERLCDFVLSEDYGVQARTTSSLSLSWRRWCQEHDIDLRVTPSVKDLEGLQYDPFLVPSTSPGIVGDMSFDGLYHTEPVSRKCIHLRLEGDNPWLNGFGGIVSVHESGALECYLTRAGEPFGEFFKDVFLPIVPHREWAVGAASVFIGEVSKRLDVGVSNIGYSTEWDSLVVRHNVSPATFSHYPFELCCHHNDVEYHARLYANESSGDWSVLSLWPDGEGTRMKVSSKGTIAGDVQHLDIQGESGGDDALIAISELGPYKGLHGHLSTHPQYAKRVSLLHEYA